MSTLLDWFTAGAQAGAYAGGAIVGILAVVVAAALVVWAFAVVCAIAADLLSGR